VLSFQKLAPTNSFERRDLNGETSPRARGGEQRPTKALLHP